MSDQINTLVTGGAGYIGSHTIRALQLAGIDNLLVLDDLSTGFRQALPQNVTLIEGDIADSALLESLFEQHKITSIIHFAAKISVEESVRKPELYYHFNAQKSFQLIDCALKYKVDNFIFSSTAAVYGNTGNDPVSENFIPNPTNPYGRSKLAVEWYLEDRFKTAGETEEYIPRWAALRYFNVAGAHMNGELGQRNPNANHLIKMCSKAARKEISALTVYGNDYQTKDGTCVRDYIHVDDLACAHVKTLEALRNNASSGIYNVGYGKGFSVLEVIDAFKNSNDVSFKVIHSQRRPGDSAEVIANSDKLRKVTGWAPKYDDINLICQSAWQWEQMLATNT